MKILIIGGSGFLGKYLIEEISNQGHDYFSFDLDNGYDVCDPQSFEKIDSNFEVVIHLASKTFVPDSYDNPYSFYHINSQGTLNALEYCRLNQARLIYISSYIYGVPQYLPIDESHPFDSFNPYCGSKIIAERLCKEYNKFWGVKSIIFRPFNIYGYGQNSLFLISQIIEQAFKGKIKVKDLNPKRDYIHVMDVVQAIIKAINYTSDDIEIFNIGSGKSHSVKEIIDITCAIVDKNIEVVSENITRKNEVLDTVANIEKIKRLLNWEPTISLHEGIKQSIDRYKTK